MEPKDVVQIYSCCNVHRRFGPAVALGPAPQRPFCDNVRPRSVDPRLPVGGRLLTLSVVSIAVPSTTSDPFLASDEPVVV